MLPPYEFAHPEIGWVLNALALTVAAGLTAVMTQPLLPQFCIPTTVKFPGVEFHCIIQLFTPVTWALPVVRPVRSAQ